MYMYCMYMYCTCLFSFTRLHSTSLHVQSLCYLTTWYPTILHGHLQSKVKVILGCCYWGSSWPWVIFNTVSATLEFSDPTCDCRTWRGTFCLCSQHVMIMNFWGSHAFQMHILNDYTNFCFLHFPLNPWPLLIQKICKKIRNMLDSKNLAGILTKCCT